MWGRTLEIATFMVVAACCPGVLHSESGNVLVKTIEPDPVTGAIISFSIDDGLVLQADRAERFIATGDLVRMSFAPPIEKRNHRDRMASLQNGDLLFGRLRDAMDDRMILEVNGIGDVSLDLDALRSLDSARAHEDSHRESFQWFAESASQNDRVLLTNGDVVSGFVTRVDAEGVLIDGALGESKIPLRLLVAIRFRTQRRSSSNDDRCLVYLRDGGRISTPVIEFDANRFAVNPRYASSFEVPLSRITRLEFQGGRWEWLADRTPISFEHTPMLGLAWEPTHNEHVGGGPLVVAGERFERGIGVHSRSSLTYDLESKYDLFVTSYGLDDESGPLGDVDVAVRVDGQERHGVQGVRPGTLYGPIRIDVRGANRIELLVDFGRNGEIQDRFDWIEPALIR